VHNEELSSRAATFTVISIGLIHTPFQHSDGTPIQSAVADGVQGIVELFP
jgi:hypothetical protein